MSHSRKSNNRKHLAQARGQRRLSLEALEGRQMMAADAQLLANGTYQIIGTNEADTIVVEALPGRQIKLVGADRGVDLNKVKSIYIDAKGGDDYVRIDRHITLPTTIIGGLGSDTLSGGDGIDKIYGGFIEDRPMDAFDPERRDDANGDTLFGHGGNDILFGKRGPDTLYGLSGDDILWGGLDADQIFGGAGVDKLFGEDGDDFLDGGGDARGNTLNGGTGIDFDAYRWTLGNTKVTDVVPTQQSTNTFLAALAAVAKTERNLSRLIVRQDDGTYNVHRTDGTLWQNVEFDGTRYASDPLTLGTQADFQEFWVILFQRAYLQSQGVIPFFSLRWF